MFHLPIMLRSIATTSLMLSHKYRLYLQPNKYSTTVRHFKDACPLLHFGIVVEASSPEACLLITYWIVLREGVCINYPFIASPVHISIIFSVHTPNKLGNRALRLSSNSPELTHILLLYVECKWLFQIMVHLITYINIVSLILY